MKELCSRVGIRAVVPSSLEDARKQLACAGVVVGARMHASLNAISQGTPCVPLAYSRKFGPLMDDLGWDLYCDLRSGVTSDHVVGLAVRALGSREKAESVAAVSQRRVHQFVMNARDSLSMADE